MVLSALQKISGSAPEVKKIDDGVGSDVIAKSFAGSIKIPLLRNLGFIEGDMNGLTMEVS